MRERPGRLLPLLALALLVGSGLVLLPFPRVYLWLSRAPLRYFLLGAAAAASLLAWWVPRRTARSSFGAAAVLLAGLCFASSIDLARRLWFLHRLQAEAKEACEGIRAPDWKEGDSAPYFKARDAYHRLRNAARERALAAAQVPEDVAGFLSIECKADGAHASLSNGFDHIWSVDEQGRLW